MSPPRQELNLLQAVLLLHRFQCTVDLRCHHLLDHHEHQHYRAERSNSVCRHVTAAWHCDTQLHTYTSLLSQHPRSRKCETSSEPMHVSMFFSVVAVTDLSSLPLPPCYVSTSNSRCTSRLQIKSHAHSVLLFYRVYIYCY